MRASYCSFHCQMRLTSSSRPRSWRVFFSCCENERLHHGLRRDAGVIGAGHPEGVVALHAPPADQHVLQRVIECVAHVQRAGHVGRRNDDGERLAVRRAWRGNSPDRSRRRAIFSGLPAGRIASKVPSWGPQSAAENAPPPKARKPAIITRMGEISRSRQRTALVILDFLLCELKRNDLMVGPDRATVPIPLRLRANAPRHRPWFFRDRLWFFLDPHAIFLVRLWLFLVRHALSPLRCVPFAR